jgi:O-antigen/teichoic acid export membrane protein
MGNAAYAGSRFLVLVILAKLGTAEMVGQFALGVAICAPVMAFTDLSLVTVMVTDVNRHYEVGDYLGLRILTTGVGILVILGIVSTFGYGREKILVILLITLDRAVSSISSIFYGLFQQHERMDFISTSGLIKSALSLSVISLLAYLTGSIVWICLGMAASTVAASCLYDFRKGLLFAGTDRGGNPGGGDDAGAAIILRPRWLAPKLMKLAWVAFPLGCVFGLISLNYNIPRFFIEKHWGARELGIFAAIYAPAAAGRFILTALASAASRRLAKYFTLGDRKAFFSLLVKLAGIGVFIGSVGIGIAALAGREILNLLYRPEYAEYYVAFLCLMFATAVNYVTIFMGYGVTAAKRFWTQIFLAGFTAGVSFIACYFLIPRYGVSGAAISEVMTQIAALTILIGILFSIRYSLKINDSAGF